MTKIEVLETTLARVEVDRDARVVRLVRKPGALDVESLNRALDSFQLMVPLRERPKLVLLQDMRQAPMVRNEEIERALIEALPRLAGKFAVRAVIIATPVGRLQATRFGSVGGGEFRVFLDEVEAERFVAGEAAKLRGLHGRGGRA